LNIMSLGGLALGVGMLVDNAIVVLENIYRLRESGEGIEEAAVEGSAEVTSAIMASTLTTLAVFLPLIFVRGMAGVMFKQLSLVVVFALLCSLAVALTLVPVLASRLLGPAKIPESTNETLVNRLFDLSVRFSEQLENSYRRLLQASLNRRKSVLISAALLFFGSLLLIPFVGVELMPSADEGYVRVTAEMEVGTRLDIMDEKFKVIENIVIEAVPEIEDMVASVGGSPWRASGSHTGRMRIALKPKNQRSRSSEEIAAILRKKLANIPGITTRIRAGQGFFLMRMATSGTEKIRIDIRGYDFEIADELAALVKRLAEEVDGVTDAQISRESGSPENLIIIDRQKAANMKLTVSRIANTLQTTLSGTPASYYREGGDEYAIRVQLKDARKRRIDEILDLTITNSDGRQIELRNVVQVKPRTGPALIERKDQERVITVSVNITGRDMGSIIADMRKSFISIPKRRDFDIVFGGDYEEQQEAFGELLLAFILAIVLVYMVMASLYESMRDPFVVMFSVPLAVIGVILILLFTNTTFNIQSFIGCIMLGGIVVNNAILLVDHTNLLRRRDGMPIRKAIEEAGRRRLRPILMTAMTTILGLMPLALGLGEGGEAQAPMARAVIGGLLSSTLITLVFVPVVYSIIEERAWKKGSENNGLQPPSPSEDSGSDKTPPFRSSR